MKKIVLMSVAKKARIALAVMAVCGFTFAGAQSAFAEIHISGNDNTYTDAKDFSTIVGSKNNLTGKDYDGEITKFTVLGSENRVNAFYEYVLSEDLAKKNQITVVGTKNNIKGTRNTVVGDNNTVYFNESIVLGQNNSLDPWTLYKYSGKNICIGNDINAQINDSNIAIGNKMTVQASWNTTLIGNEIKNYGASEAVILGSNINATYGRSVMVGNRTSAYGNSVALGYNAVAAVAGAEAFGARSRAEKNFSVAIGYGSLADEENTVSVGSNKERTITESNGTTTTIPTRYRRIVNMADGTNNHDAATYGQIIKKDNYTISLDSTGNGQAVLKTNADKEGPTIKVDASALETQINKNADAIGTLTNLTTTEKGNLVGAVNEVKGTADAAQTKANDAFTQANTNKASIGTLTNLTTTEKGNLVGAVNEVKGSVDAANTAIAGKADLGLSNINAAGETVIKNLAKTEAGAIVNVQLGDLSTEKYYVDAGKKVNENISALDKQVKVNADAIDLKANKDLSNINATGENKIKTIAGVVVEGKLGTLTSSNYVDAANTVNANISALDVQVKDNADKITTVDSKIGSLSADGKYIKQAKNVSDNLVELDNQVNANATALTTKANLDLSNITVAGETKIKDLASIKAGEVVNVKLGAITSTHYVTTGNTVNANISALDTQLNKVDNKVGTMTNGNYISAGNTVAGNLSALDNQLKANTDAIAEKADKNLSNISDAGKNVIKNLANEKAGEVVADKLGTITSNNYVSAGNTVNANISKLDEQVKVNADAINTKADKNLSNITDAGKNVIKDLANEKAGEVVADKLGTITSNNYVNASNTVNANISALDKQMKVNTENIGDTSKLNGLGSNLSDAVVNVNNKVGTADELKALKDAGLGDNLAQATAAVNKKADKNAEDINKVNGRVDELGGRVDTLGGAVAKLDSRVNKVGAGAAALAALHPMEFDSDNKLSFAAGVGNYRGTNAAAIGAFYRPSEQVMFSISGNMGNGENMVNAGVSFALDRPSKTPTTKAALVKTVVAQNEQIAALNETVAEQNEKIARLEAMVEKLAAKQNA